METDVVILGSGASALTAALAANGHGSDVMMFEKADKIGGTSGWPLNGSRRIIQKKPHRDTVNPVGMYVWNLYLSSVNHKTGCPQLEN